MNEAQERHNTHIIEHPRRFVSPISSHDFFSVIMAEHTSILIIGAGELGIAVLTAFNSKQDPNLDISVLLRSSTASLPSNDAKVASIYALSPPVQVISCDLLGASQADLTNIFKSFDVIIGCTGYDSNAIGLGEGLQFKIAEAVFEAKSVKLYVPWQFGVDYDQFEHDTAGGLFSEQKCVRDFLREAVAKKEVTTQWIIISTGIFMSYMFSDFWGVVKRNDDNDLIINALGSWDVATTITQAEDIGRLTAEIVLTLRNHHWDDDALKNRSVYIAGDTVTYNQIFDLVKAISQRPVIRGESASLINLQQKLEQDGGNILSKYQVAFGRGKGVAWDKGNTFNVLHRIPVTDVKSWLLTHFNSI
jgi:hypothetical protein